MRDYDGLVERLHKRIASTAAGSPLQDDLLEAADAIEELMYIAKAKNDGKILILNDKIALAMAAGARAIRGNKRLAGTTYVYDVFGKDGGPYEINYNDASEILTTIWNAYPLPEPPKEDDNG